jgi:ABC-type uncharacterized transport system permease subunit
MRFMATASSRRLNNLAARPASLAGLAVVVGGGWFLTMELFLRHPGYQWRAMAAAAIVVEGALTIVLLEDMVTLPALRWPLTAGAGATGLLGGWIITQDLALPGLPARPHFEGYLLIIGLALIAYGLLTIAAMLTAARARSPRASAPPS